MTTKIFIIGLYKKLGFANNVLILPSVRRTKFATYVNTNNIHFKDNLHNALIYKYLYLHLFYFTKSSMLLYEVKNFIQKL